MIRLNDLKTGSTVSVHFVLPDEIDIEQHSPDMAVMTGSLAEVETDKELFSVIASAMHFPSYFGNNWDALDECLGDMDWLPAHSYTLILYDAQKGWSQCPYVIGRFVTAWLEAAEYWKERNIPFYLLFVM